MIHRQIRDIIQTQMGSVSSMNNMLQELANDEGTLEEKIRKRSMELERVEKRLKGI